MKKATELIFIPIPGIGHIVSTVEIAKLLLSRDDNLSITVLVMKFPFNVDGTEAYIESLSKQQRINFVNLPQQQFREPGVMGFFTFADQYIPAVKDTVTKLVESDTSRVSAFVVDMFCTSMIDVANELGLPTYIFYTSGAADLGLMFHLQVLRDEHGKDCTEFKDTVETELVVPSFVHPLPAAKVLPSIVFDKVSGDSCLDFSKRYRETKGILVNTFLELEPHALRSLSSDDNIPPVYPVGPILSVNSSQEGSDEKSKLKSDVLEWLDDQPPSSVVFLCFGSMGCFGVEQVKEIATALDQSGFRFLWSLRQPPDDSDTSFPRDYADYGRVLPEGFLERTADRGKVIGWAPQVAILAHSSIGGFVSHCGWNSTLESIWFGVPIAAWPLYAEQQLNAFELVEELKLAVEIDVGYRRGSGVIVSRSEIERGIKELMESDSEVRKRMKEMSEMSRKSMLQGGSSYTSLGRFIDQIQSLGQCNSYAKPNLSNLNLNLNLNLKVS